MNKFEVKRANEFVREARERTREAHGVGVPETYARVADTLDPATNEISYPEPLPDTADAKTKWEYQDHMELAFTKVLARVGGAAREAGDVLVGTEVYHQLVRVNQAQERLKNTAKDDLGAFYREKQDVAAAEQALEQMVLAREATDPTIRKKLAATKDIMKLVTSFQEDLKTRNVMDYFNRRSEMIEREGLPAEVAPSTVPEMKAVPLRETIADRPRAREKRADDKKAATADTLISDTMLVVDTGRERTPLPGAREALAKIESLGGTYQMQRDVIEAGGRVLRHVAKKIRETGTLYGQERKAA